MRPAKKRGGQQCDEKKPDASVSEREGITVREGGRAWDETVIHCSKKDEIARGRVGAEGRNSLRSHLGMGRSCFLRIVTQLFLPWSKL